MEIEPISTKSYINLNVKSKRILLTACHQIPNRSIYFKGKPLLCFRCFGINIGFIISMIFQVLVILFTFFNVNIIYFVVNDRSQTLTLRFLVTILLAIPLIIDGSIQLIVERYESNNRLRLITGLLAGVSQFYFVFNLGSLTRYYLF